MPIKNKNNEPTGNWATQSLQPGDTLIDWESLHYCLNEWPVGQTILTSYYLSVTLLIAGTL